MKLFDLKKVANFCSLLKNFLVVVDVCHEEKEWKLSYHSLPETTV